MKSGRLEAFSDGVLAIVITIMVLEMKAPEEITLESLFSVWPVFISYLLSFIYLGIYWNNHHHLMQVTEKVNGTILWANLHLLFWLSLIPFSTSWLGENYSAPLPVALYGFILLMSAIAYRILEIALIRYHGKEHVLQKALNKGKKELISMVLYIISIPAAFINIWLALGCIVFVAILWIVPERKIENLIKEKNE
ncbi:TMEM175 family protein [Zhouia amylolytica]|uniref:TMEM175 family protein n=1 Tax=Zhouia amylolytica TaxID=376730 RepID=UPI0020CFC171|nr:TMEM175 family protein [Zhouia amylolytica]MCQ0110711.1 DUF1211 domain-containing protein [Zhouia amylolytica]